MLVEPVLFRNPLENTFIAAPTDTKLSMHIFVADKGDYHDIADGLPQNEQ